MPIPDASHALEDAQVDLSRNCVDPDDFSVEGYNTLRWDVLYGRYPAFNEILGLIAGRVSSVSYLQAFNCLAGLNVGDSSYISGNNTVSKADATNDIKKRVCGWIRYKPTPTTCYIEHYQYKSGLAGTAGNPVYLQDDGSLGPTPGTKSKVLGTYISTSEAMVHADFVTSQD